MQPKISRRIVKLMKKKPLTCIDLFAGCGGFSLGLHRAGLKILAAIDFDPKAIEVYRANFYSTPHILCKDLTQFSAEELEELIGTNRLDVIAGGPPCQGFSQVRQRDGANNGVRIIHDPRRTLYQQYFEYVKHFQPKLFVMENVLGLRSADGGKYFRAIQFTARECGYRVVGITVDAWKFGVPQKRRRQLIVGTHLSISEFFRESMIQPVLELEGVTLGDAIGDLPRLAPASGTDPSDYDLERRTKHEVCEIARKYLYEVLEVDKADKLTAHIARPHSERDIRDFKKLKEGETAKQALERGETMEFPYDRASFNDRYTRQHRRRLCSTIVAHLSKDGLMFIHPTQDRSLTAREAARIQSFPDTFKFPIPRTHQYRVIGNAVPPLIGQAVGAAIDKYLEIPRRMPRKEENRQIPKNIHEAATRVGALVDAVNSRSIRKLTDDEFIFNWKGVAYLLPGLHPDSHFDHGLEISNEPCHQNPLVKSFPFLSAPYYTQSGWPVALKPVLAEAWRRHNAGSLADDELYSVDSQHAGMDWSAVCGERSA